jgi:surfeit locus 1 family protein
MNSEKHAIRWGLHLSALTGLAVLLTLGTWQMKRLSWKEELLAAIETRMSSTPEPLAAIEDRFRQSGDVDYYPLKLTGTFINDGEQYFLSTFDGQSGWNIYTPLQLADRRIVMVNRGFVPYDLRDPSKRPQSIQSGKSDIVGLARNALDGKPSSLTPDNDPKSNTWYWKDLFGMAGNAKAVEAGLLPFFVDDWTETKPDALPRTRTTIVSLPNNHLQYAITWYGLAAALAGVWIVFARTRPSSKSAA